MVLVLGLDLVQEVEVQDRAIVLIGMRGVVVVEVGVVLEAQVEASTLVVLV